MGQAVSAKPETVTFKTKTLTAMSHSNAVSRLAIPAMSSTVYENQPLLV